MRSSFILSRMLIYTRTGLTETKSSLSYSVSDKTMYLNKLTKLPKLSSSYLKNTNYGFQSISFNEFSTTITLAKAKKNIKEIRKAAHINEEEMAELIDVEKLKFSLESEITKFKDDLMKYSSLRTNINAIEQVPVEFEGKKYTVQQLTQISRKPKLVVLNGSTFPQAIPQIIKSLSKTNMNLNPQQDGTMIYVQIPKVTKDHREKLSKHAKLLYNKCCDNLKNIRNSYTKQVKNQDTVSKDLVFRIETQIDALVHQHTLQAENLLNMKQKELMGE